MHDLDVAVIGAGLAGISCARVLHRHGLRVQLFESSDGVGGRIRTDVVDGFRLDRGFQVFNSAYPQLKDWLTHANIDARYFDQSLLVASRGRLWPLADPRRRPASVIQALRAPEVGVTDLMRTAAHLARCGYGRPAGIKHGPDTAVRTHWQQIGLSDRVIDRVLSPFFTGLLLDRNLTTSSRFTDLMTRMFVRGHSGVPAQGMQRLPELLAADLHVTVDTPVQRISGSTVQTTAGPVAARAVVVATGAAQAARLLPGLPAPDWRGVTTWYHVAPTPPVEAAALIIDPDRSPVDNTVVMTNAAPTYSPDDRALIATSWVHDGTTSPDDSDIRHRLTDLYGADATSWTQIARYDVPHALPSMPAPHPLHRPVRWADCYVCGDHRDTSSIQGALASGRRAARAVLADLDRPSWTTTGRFPPRAGHDT